MILRRGLFIVVIAALPACFASSSDFEKLSSSVEEINRREQVRDSLQRAEMRRLVALSRSMGALSDSLNFLYSRLTSLSTLTDSTLTGLRQDVAQLQDLSGQSEQRLRDLRVALEERAAEPTSSDTNAESALGPGPAQLLQIGRDQMLKHGYSSARAAFDDLVKRFPTSDLAPDAMFESAQSYRAENDLEAADSAYAAFVTRFPTSSHTATALYKRALILQTLGKPTQARRLFEEVRRKFPRSPEAALAKDRLSGR